MSERNIISREILAGTGLILALVTGCEGENNNTQAPDQTPRASVEAESLDTEVDSLNTSNTHIDATPTATEELYPDTPNEWRIAYFDDGTAEMQRLDAKGTVLRSLLVACTENGNISTRSIGVGFEQMPYNEAADLGTCSDKKLLPEDTADLSQVLAGWAEWQPLEGRS